MLAGSNSPQVPPDVQRRKKSKRGAPPRAPRRFRLNAGSGAVDIRMPDGVALRVEYDGGSGALIAPGLRKVSGGRRDGVYESAGFSPSGQYILVELDGGSGSVTIR
jgi:hypothetical protein